MVKKTAIPAPGFLQETTPTDLIRPSLVNNRNAAGPAELCHIPALLHHREDDDDASKASSILAGVMANWEGVKDEKEDNVPISGAGINLLRAAGITLHANELAPDDDNKEEDEYKDDIRRWRQCPHP